MGIEKLKAIIDSSIIIHLCEIGQFDCLKIFEETIISENCYKEIKVKNSFGFEEVENLQKISIAKEEKDFSAYLSIEYGISLADAEIIAIAKRRRLDILLTDDLNIREVAKSLGIKVVGTIGILLKAFKEKIISKNIVISSLEDLHKKSSLFITKKIVEDIKREVEGFKRQ